MANSSGVPDWSGLGLTPPVKHTPGNEQSSHPGATLVSSEKATSSPRMKGGYAVAKESSFQTGKSVAKGKVAVSRKRAAQEAEVPPEKKKRGHASGRQKGTKVYTENEVERLLEAVGCIQPTCDDHWKAVKVALDAMAPPDAPVRTVKSLKCKLKSVSVKLVMNALADMPAGQCTLNVNPIGNMFEAKKSTVGQSGDDGKESGGDDKELGGDNGHVSNGSDGGSGKSPVEENAPCEEDTVHASESAGSDNVDRLDKDGNASNDDEDGSMGEEAGKLSEAMIDFFHKFNAANGMVIGKENLDLFASRLQKIESDVEEMKGVFESINANMSAILSAVQQT